MKDQETNTKKNPSKKKETNTKPKTFKQLGAWIVEWKQQHSERMRQVWSTRRAAIGTDMELSLNRSLSAEYQ